MATQHAKVFFSDDKVDKSFSLNVQSVGFAVKFTVEIYYIDKTEIEFDKNFDENNIYLSLFNLRNVIHIPSFGMVNLLYCGGQFSNITFIDVKTKYRSLNILDVSQTYLQNHIRTSLRRPQGVSEGRPQDAGRTRLLELNI